MTTTGELQSSISTSASLSPLSHMNSCIDPNDIDSFINYDQPIYPSPSLSPASSRAKTTINPSPVSTPAVANAPSFSPSSSNSSNSSSNNSQHSSSQVFFSGPSHEYDSYKQQTGLPPGGLANTMAINRNAGMEFGLGNQHNFVMPSEAFINPTQEMVNFGSSPLPTMPFRNSGIGLDLEPDTPTDFMFSPQFPAAKAQFVDPNALGGHEHELSTLGQPNQVGRMYPGMHQQQAAMAKAAQQQRQQEIIRQQQQQEQQQQQQQEEQNQQQRQQQQQQQQHGRQASKAQNKANRSSDPVVEERISRLLHQMRQSSVTSAANEEDSKPQNVSHVSRSKKEEDEMDEDERLLASEEGKKLSSKERRQLRNKVSARAFRSRRKEYIGQLEGEVASKTNETNDLRLQNRVLVEENTRLMDLTRMLLSSPHFASFLNDMTINSGPPAAPQPAQPSAMQAPSQQQQQQPPKDANPSHVSADIQMQNHQVGMAMVPEQSADFAGMDMNTPGWNTGIDMSYNTPVFAVLDVPEGPDLDSAVLSGKSSNSVGPISSDEIKEQMPSIERPPPVAAGLAKDMDSMKPTPEVEIDESDSSLALFYDQPRSRSPPSSTTPATTFEDTFGGITPEKLFARIDLVIYDDGSAEEGGSAGSPGVSTATMARFEHLCSSIEGAYQRVSFVTAHLLEDTTDNSALD
ncbi:hypothetical protein AJ78_00468 [Emergomyces pasteurianus Ep9510]|uniref:BZIP domain-containing protein n=1 Tax=Emergomyces pasteurianus Ep9510 TaxID=1447872 RepID=A0A1J9QHD5_9EURO|nr:hypothetical protein AJ78_00468 [Emergomyces pasteurianus Ep9510]